MVTRDFTRFWKKYGQFQPTQFKVVSLVEIREDTARKIGARGLTSVSTDWGKSVQREVPIQGDE